MINVLISFHSEEESEESEEYVFAAVFHTLLLWMFVRFVFSRCENLDETKTKRQF